jgi:hypothetical protein
MSEDGNRATVEKVLAGIDAGDTTVMEKLFSDSGVLEWPASNERVVGVENRRAVYSNMPMLPRVKMRRILGRGDLWIAEATLTYGDKPYAGVLIFEFEDGKIVKQTGYWAEPFAAPAWRAAWVEKIG